MKITFIQTGGTIDKAYPMNDDNHGYNFEISDPAFERILARVKPSFEYETLSVLRKDSLDITDEDREAILAACEAAPSDRIVLTHGTDTMLETARLLSKLANKTIVLTGALLPEQFKNSDADFNLGTAIGAVAVLGHGVYVAMGGQVNRWDEVRFDDEAGQFVPVAG